MSLAYGRGAHTLAAPAVGEEDQVRLELDQRALHSRSKKGSHLVLSISIPTFESIYFRKYIPILGSAIERDGIAIAIIDELQSLAHLCPDPGDVDRVHLPAHPAVETEHRKITQRRPQSWAKLRPLIGILIPNTGPSRAMWHNPAQLTLAGSSTPGNDLAAMGRKVIVLQAPHLFLLGALPGISAQPRTGTRSEAIEKSAREPSMWCSRAGSKLLKFARAAIFRPDMINSGSVVP